MPRASRIPLLAACLILLCAAIHAAEPRFARSFGSTASSEDRARAVAPAVGGGYYLGGYTSGADYDYWLVKTLPSGAVAWSYTYGSPVADYLTSVDATADGGAVMAGYTYGFEGAADIDILVIKVGADGALQWSKTYAGNPATGTPPGSWGDHEDFARAIRQTADGGFILVGDTLSFGTGINRSVPETDGWALRLDSTGGVLWERTYGDQYWWSSGTETFRAVVEDQDGNFGVTGWARSYGPGREELWVLKLSGVDGSFFWVKILPALSYGASIEVTSDNGFIVGGNGYFSTNQLIMARFDGAGAVVWDKHFGGGADESGGYAVQTSDGGFALSGGTSSYGAGGVDAWVLKTDSAGALQWQRTYGGAGDDEVRGAVASGDGGLALAAQTNSIGTAYDFWALRLGADGLVSPPCPFSAGTGAPAADIAETWYSPLYTPPDPPIPTVLPSYAVVAAVSPARAEVTPTTVEQCGVHGPYLAWQSHLIADNGNGDGIADPGETLTITVTAQNVGIVNSTSNTGVLSTVTPGVTVTQNTSAYPDLAVGSSGACTTAYTVTVAPSVPCGTPLQFVLAFGGEGPGAVPFASTDSFEVTVGTLGAPVALLDENFDSGLPAGWTVVNGGDPGMTWADNDPCGRALFSSRYMIADTWCAGSVVMDEELITPVMDCASAASVTLSFDSYYRSYYDTADVDVRSSATGGAWTNVLRWTLDDVGARSVDLTAFAAGAADAQVRWRLHDAYYGYYWGIDNVRVETVSATCDPLGPVPEAFSLVAPLDGATDRGCTETLDWEDSTGAAAYDVYLGTSDPPGLHTSDVAASQLQVTGLTMGATYFWKVVAKNAEGTTPSLTWDFSVKAAPAVTGDSTGCTFPGVVLSTQAFSTYQWARNGEDITGATGQTLTATSSGNYTVRVTDGAGCTATSAAHVLALTDSPATPGAPGVADVAACATSGVTITWGAVAGATGYDLLVDGGTVVPDVTSGYLYSPGNTASHSYQVRAKTATCTGDWSAGTAGADANLTPPAVTNLSMQKVGSDLVMTWTRLADPSAADYYEVMRSLSPSGPFNVSVGTATGIVHGLYLDLAGEPATAYYKVRAVKGSCIGPLD